MQKMLFGRFLKFMLIGFSISSLSFGPLAFGEEGLWADSRGLNSSQNAYWNSVFFFVNDVQGEDGSGVLNMGTAFAVRRITRPSGTVLEFLTAYHVVIGICSSSSCGSSSLYRGYQLYGDNSTSIVSGLSAPAIRYSKFDVVYDKEVREAFFAFCDLCLVPQPVPLCPKKSVIIKYRLKSQNNISFLLGFNNLRAQLRTEHSLPDLPNRYELMGESSTNREYKACLVMA